MLFFFCFFFAFFWWKTCLVFICYQSLYINRFHNLHSMRIPMHWVRHIYGQMIVKTFLEHCPSWFFILFVICLLLFDFVYLLIYSFIIIIIIIVLYSFTYITGYQSTKFSMISFDLGEIHCAYEWKRNEKKKSIRRIHEFRF